MTALLITRGLPASGKTTVARQWVAESPGARIRVDRDDLRLMLFGRPSPLTHDEEQTVTVAQHAQVEALLRADRSVVVDDTHLRLRHARAWADLASTVGAAFVVIDLDTPVDVCVQRDLHRDRQVGEQVIRDLAARFHGRPQVLPSAPPASRFLPYTPNLSLPSAWILDMDGTLAIRGDHDGVRGWFDEDRVGEDTPHPPVVDLTRALWSAGYEIVVMSGRSTACEQETRDWLRAEDIPCDALFMRKAGDQRPDAIVKHELFHGQVAPLWNIKGAIDDRKSVVRMWRSIGLTCAQVDEGDF